MEKQEIGAPREGIEALCSFFIPCFMHLFIQMLILSFILSLNKLVNISKFSLSFVSHFSKLIKPKEDSVGTSNLYPVGQNRGSSLGTTAEVGGGKCPSYGTELLTCGVWCSLWVDVRMELKFRHSAGV